MIVVRVELWSARTGEQTELARMSICNLGGGLTDRRADYSGIAYAGRGSAALNRHKGSRHGEVRDWPRLDKHVWNLVAAMLSTMGYGR